MNANSRTARRIIKARRTVNQAKTRVTKGPATLATHCRAVGLTNTEAASVAGSLRKAAAKAGIQGTEGTAFRKGKRVTVRRYTATQVASAAALYRPKKAAYRAAREFLLAA